MHNLGISGEGELRGQLTNPGSSRKMAIKMECLFVCVYVFFVNLSSFYVLQIYSGCILSVSIVVFLYFL